MIRDIDPPRLVIGKPVNIIVNRVLPAAEPAINFRVTFDGVPATVLDVQTYGLTVVVPNHLTSGSRPYLVVQYDNLESTPALMPIVYDRESDGARISPSPTSLADRPNVWILAGGVGTAAVILIFALQILRRARRREREAQQRSKTLEALRADLTIPPATDATGGEPVSAVPLVVPDNLLASFATGQCVLFAGVGLEAALGGPIIAETLIRLAETADFVADPDAFALLPAALRAGEIEQVKETLLAALGGYTVKRQIKEVADRTLIPLNAMARTLSYIPFVGAVTLSWSHMLDRVFENRLHPGPAGTKNQREGDVPGLKVGGSGFFLLRPFGEPGSTNFSFTLREFREIRERKPELSRFLASTMSRNSILFLGCQVEEIESFIVAANIRATSDRLHYAVVPRGPVFGLQRTSMRSAYKIDLIGYDPRDPDALEGFVEELGRKLSVAGPASIPARSGVGRREEPRIDEVRLTNIGPFDEITIKFTQKWSVLLANNGSGKTTILKAIAVALAGKEDRVTERCANLLKQGADYGCIEVKSGDQTFKSELIRDRSQRRIDLVSPQDSPIQSGRWAVFGFPAVRGVPMVAEERRVSGHPEPLVDDVVHLLGIGADPRLNDLRRMIIDTHAKSEDTTVNETDRNRAKHLRDALFSALDKLTPGFEIRFDHIDHDMKEVHVKTADGVLPLSALSQGISSTFGWAGTVMSRLYDIYRTSPDPASEPALLLLDEIDAHLHPKWQQTIAPTIKTIFPKLVVLATTHSGLVIGTLNAGEVIRVRRAEGDAGHAFEVETTPDYRDHRVDQIYTDVAFELDTAQDPALEHARIPLREEYARLVRLPNPTIDDRRRLAEVMRDLAVPLAPPGETRMEREASLEAVEQTKQLEALIVQMSSPDYRPGEVDVAAADRQP